MNDQNTSLTIQPRRVAWIFLGAAMVVAVFSFLGQYLTLFPGSFTVHTPMEAYILDNYFILEFKLNTASNVVIFFKAFILLPAAAFLFFIIAKYKKSVQDKFERSWFALSLFFLYLSIDAAAILPEKYVKFYNAWTDTNGWFLFRWVFILVVLLILGFLFHRFFMHLEAGYRIRLMISFTLYYAGLLGVELFSGHYTTFYNTPTLGLAAITSIAELMGSGGVILMIYTLLQYIEVNIPEIKFLTQSTQQVNGPQRSVEI